MYTFEEKNRIIIRYASAEFFDKDKELFFKHCSNPRLEKDIKRANPFTHDTLDSRILNELLSKVKIEDIIANRIGSSVKKETKLKKTTSKKSIGSKTSKPKQPTKTKEVNEIKKTDSVERDKKKEASEKNSQT